MPQDIKIKYDVVLYRIIIHSANDYLSPTDYDNAQKCA